jgi:hypothetical protein
MVNMVKRLLTKMRRQTEHRVASVNELYLKQVSISIDRINAAQMCASVLNKPRPLAARFFHSAFMGLQGCFTRFQRRRNLKHLMHDTPSHCSLRDQTSWEASLQLEICD